MNNSMRQIYFIINNQTSYFNSGVNLYIHISSVGPAKFLMQFFFNNYVFRKVILRQSSVLKGVLSPEKINGYKMKWKYENQIEKMFMNISMTQMYLRNQYNGLDKKSFPKNE